MAHDEPAPRLDYFSFLWAVLILNITVMMGMALHELIAASGLTLPAFVSCLLAGILMRNLTIHTFGPTLRRVWPGVRDALALIGDLALGLFLTMTFMGLQLWKLDGSLAFILLTLTLQIALALTFALLVVFPAMGRDYEAVVIASGFGGITLGSTATAIASMTAVAQQHGAAHRAFIIVPLRRSQCHDDAGRGQFGDQELGPAPDATEGPPPRTRCCRQKTCRCDASHVDRWHRIPP